MESNKVSDQTKFEMLSSMVDEMKAEVANLRLERRNLDPADYNHGQMSGRITTLEEIIQKLAYCLKLEVEVEVASLNHEFAQSVLSGLSGLRSKK